MTVSSSLTSDTVLRTAAGGITKVHWINISNDGTGAGTAGQVIIENAAGTDQLLIPFASTQHQSRFLSFKEPLRIEAGLNINFVTVTKAIVDVGWE